MLSTMENFENIWLKAKEQLISTMPTLKSILLSEVEFGEEKDDMLTLTVSSPFYKSRVEKDLSEAIENTVSELSHRNIHVNFVINESAFPPAEEKKKTVVKKKEVTETISRNPTLNKDYTFDNFVQGDNSSLAFGAAQVIAKNPGISFNPCLIYGGVGLGKTHLLQSIGNYIDEHNPRMKVIYVTAESFTNEFVAALSENKTQAFKNKYRSVDCLLIDDIHFLQKKEGTQEELFHTFNALYEEQKQIVLTCDRPITELTDITERLKTRFRKGMNANLLPPSYETRLAIALKKCKEKGYNLDRKVMEYVCQNVNTNVRDLEGALVTLASFADLVGKPATIDIAKEQLKNFTVSPAVKNNDVTIDMIVRNTANYFNMSEYDIKGKSRNKNITLARQISIYLTSVLTTYSLSEIGKAMGGKDHTTISHSIDKIKSLMEADESVKSAVESIKDLLLG